MPDARHALADDPHAHVDPHLNGAGELDVVGEHVPSLLGAGSGDDLDADSLDLVELVMALEEAFNVEVPEEELDGIETVGQAYELVTGKLG